MPEKKYLVPEGMLKAATVNFRGSTVEMSIEMALQDAMRWLAENPMVPPPVVIREMVEAQKVDRNRPDLYVHYVCADWQRRMFLAPEPEVPEEIRDLLYPEQQGNHAINARIETAYLRGKESRGR